MRYSAILGLVVLCLTVQGGRAELEQCPGETRYDKKCNHSPTHRVCAKIGDPHTSFWEGTGQGKWCGTIGYYGGLYGNDVRCPEDNPTWCICKWATARWIEKVGQCDDSIEFNCKATDVCNVKHSYEDYKVDLKVAHDCLAQKCPEQWNACGDTPE